MEFVMCCVGRGLCDELVIRPEESNYVCVCVCDLTAAMWRPRRRKVYTHKFEESHPRVNHDITVLLLLRHLHFNSMTLKSGLSNWQRVKWQRKMRCFLRQNYNTF